ncbi:MAG: urease accessory protein UreE [Cyanothece sp. SIO1E1]|nr:urease accessory protein UreE [Cyanothece sp. SIO1E1]
MILQRRLPPNSQSAVLGDLPLTATERTRTRTRYHWSQGDIVYLQLPRGTVLNHGDLLQSDTGQDLVRVIAKPEPVFTVTADNALDLLRTAYHLGNRHVPLEITATYLRLSPDPVLKTLLVDHLQVNLLEELAPFCPETGAYHHHHG